MTEEGWKLNDKGGVVGPDQRHTLLGAVGNQKPNVSREYFGEIRSFLRLVARGRRKLNLEDFEKLEAKVRWVLSVNPERDRVLGPLLAEALAEVQASQKEAP